MGAMKMEMGTREELYWMIEANRVGTWRCYEYSL
jgi:hypothetical protein